MSSTSEQDAPQAIPGVPEGSFLSTILTPGSSFRPEFLHILDAAFFLLLTVLLALFWLSSWNLHVLVLIGIELALWASVKWFVHELQLARSAQAQTTQSGDDSTGKSKNE